MAFLSAFWDPAAERPPIRYSRDLWQRNVCRYGITYRRALAEEIVREHELDLFETLHEEDYRQFPDRAEFLDAHREELGDYLPDE